MVKNSFIEETYVVGTHWNWNSNVYLQHATENKERKLFGSLHFPSIMSIVFTSFKLFMFA